MPFWFSIAGSRLLLTKLSVFDCWEPITVDKTFRFSTSRFSTSGDRCFTLPLFRLRTRRLPTTRRNPQDHPGPSKKLSQVLCRAAFRLELLDSLPLAVCLFDHRVVKLGQLRLEIPDLPFRFD